MDLIQFAQAIVGAANKGAPIDILPVSTRDFNNKCILRFRLGTIY